MGCLYLRAGTFILGYHSSVSLLHNDKGHPFPVSVPPPVLPAITYPSSNLEHYRYSLFQTLQSSGSLVVLTHLPPVMLPSTIVGIVKKRLTARFYSSLAIGDEGRILTVATDRASDGKLAGGAAPSSP
ncbi:hypothetical protein P691DRAFT_801409 [Macrolepiota fuliginosa MF-IS2]|uniref:Uncharacterized protein n=1 Tax=Macrolepiota fuliginosa MF-IS2 TaxID=1400762 RepID=A0A9P6BWN7_9AGAR|nr:hypothetical protein P691DRAFT_801409 [Macrolepiota fuliginosa MF-IS2]